MTGSLLDTRHSTFTLRRHPICLLFLIIAFATSIYCLWLRYQAESAYRQVELVVDMDDVEAIATAGGSDLSSALVRFKSAGATAVALTEQTLEDLRLQGRIQIYVRGQRDTYIDERNDVLPSRFAVLVTTLDNTLFHRLLIGRSRDDIRELKTDEGKALAVAIPTSGIEEFGAGFEERQIAAIKDAGLGVVARTRNPTALRRDRVRSIVETIKRTGAKSVIFSEQEVLGYRDLLPITANELAGAHLVYGSIEFARQWGDARLSLLSHGNILRVHSITEREMPPFIPAEAVERYTRAVAERNIRLCYLHLFRQQKLDPLGSNLDYVHNVSTSLERRGFQMGGAEPIRFEIRPRYVFLIALGVVAGTVLLIDWFLPLTTAIEIALLGVGSLISGGLVLYTRYTELSGDPDIRGLAIVALVAAIVFPCLAMVRCGLAEWFAGQPLDRGWEHSGAGALVRASVWSGLGGIFIGALLANWIFMTQTQQFMGVKVSQLFPLLFACFVYVAEAYPRDGETSKNRRSRVMTTIRHILERPVRLYIALIGVVALGALALWLARTGNQPGVGVSDLELRFRSILERILIVRPRTKEFAFAHPALILAVFFLARGYPSWATWFAAAAVIGQASLLNSFCHLHTPLHVALFRGLHGIWIGAVIGWVAGRLLEKYIPATSPPDKRCPPEAAPAIA